MSLQELIDYCYENNITDLSKVDLYFNMSEGGPESFISVSKSGLSIEHNTFDKTRISLYIDSY